MGADVAAIVPAAGAGRRFGGRVSKPFSLILREPLLAHTLRVFQRSPAVRWIVLVVRPEDRTLARRLLARYRITKALEPCLGGPSRAASVARGMAAVPRDAAWVLVHDAARPCVSLQLIQRVVRAARAQGAVACGLPASLTVKAVDDSRDVRLTLDRETLWFVQTPQVFRRDWFTQALARTNGHLAAFPDDAAIVESAGFAVRMIPGDPLNIKVTTKDDLLLAHAILQRRKKNGARRLHGSAAHSSMS